MPLRYFKTKKQIQKKNARNEKNLLEIREVGKKTCGKPYPPRLNSSGVIQLFSGRGGGVGWRDRRGLKSFPGFEEG